MNVMTPALAAAFRLASALPSRRHFWQPPPDLEAYGHLGAIPPHITARRREAIREMLKEKPRPNYERMGARLGITGKAVVYHVRAIEAGE